MLTEAIRKAVRREIQLRHDVTGAPTGLRRIGAECGVSPATLSRFLGGEACNSDALDKLAAWTAFPFSVPR